MVLYRSLTSRSSFYPYKRWSPTFIPNGPHTLGKGLQEEVHMTTVSWISEEMASKTKALGWEEIQALSFKNRTHARQHFLWSEGNTRSKSTGF